MSKQKPWKQFPGVNTCYVMEASSIVACCRNADTATQIVREHNAHDDLLASLRGNPYGTFADALCNLADELLDTTRARAEWVKWLQDKAKEIRATVAKAEAP